jgi:hypothetical protein
MTITFERDNDVIVYALEKIIAFARENQYLFMGKCVWWIAGIIGLDSGLTIYIDTLEVRKQIGQLRISPTPRDIGRSASANSQEIEIEKELLSNNTEQKNQPQRNSWSAKRNQGNKVLKLSKGQRKKLAREVSLEDKPAEYIPDPLRRTRKGRINPLPQTKTQLKKARKAKRSQEAKQKEDAERKQWLLANRA